MSQKTDTEVIIGGKVFTLSGYESEAYLQKVASYINNKLAEYNKVDSFKRLPGDMQNVLLQLNVADDYFKAKNQAEKLTAELEKKERELYSVRHDLIEARLEIENLKKEKKAGSGQNNRRNEQHAGKQNNVGNNVNSVNSGNNTQR